MKNKKILDAVTVFIIAVVIILFVSPYMTALLGTAGTAVSELLLAVTVIAALLLRKRNVAKELSLSLPSIHSFFCSVLLIFGANALQNAASYLYIGIFGETSSTDITFLTEYFSDTSPFTALILVALIPAVCEELLFRGFLLGCFKKEDSVKFPLTALLIPAILFSVIHLDPYKLLPLLIMGLAYGYIAIMTGSVLLPMIFHFINNAMALVSFYSIPVQESADTAAILKQSSYLWVALSALGIGIMLSYLGIKALIRMKTKKGVTAIVIILSIILFIAGISNMVYGEMDSLYTKAYNTKLRSDTEFTESFTIDRNRVTMVTVVSLSADTDVSVTITDKKGEAVYEYPKDTGAASLMLEAGKYNIKYKFDADEEKSVAQSVALSVEVSGFVEFTQTNNDRHEKEE